MADEAIIVELLGNRGDPIQYTCLDANAIPKGTVLELEDLRTVKVMSATDKPVAGIAAHEKVASDGSSTIGVYTNGIFKMVVGSTGCTVGSQVVSESGTNNHIKDLDTLDSETGDVLGYALETGTNGETVLVRVMK